jgi:hypothetical protein
MLHDFLTDAVGRGHKVGLRVMGYRRCIAAVCNRYFSDQTSMRRQGARVFCQSAQPASIAAFVSFFCSTIRMRTVDCSLNGYNPSRIHDRPVNFQERETS